MKASSGQGRSARGGLNYQGTLFVSGEKMRIGMAQINTTVGDLKGNTRKCIELIRKAEEMDLDIVTFPELTITGYPPEDLLLKSGFIDDNIKCLQKIVRSTGDIVAVVGFVDRTGDCIYNSAAVIQGRKILGIYHKVHLPNYGVFDEKRYFAPGKKSPIFSVKGINFNIAICEDIWTRGALRKLLTNGVNAVLVINASPYYYGKIKVREDIVSHLSRKEKVKVFYNNLVGGQDELVFDGNSFITDEKGRIVRRGKSFEEDLIIYDDILNLSPARQNIMSPEQEVYSALKLGLADYVRKNGFRKVVVALSGGIDSSLVAVIAADTLGKENVLGVFMPSQYSSNISKEDVERLAENLGIRLVTIPIQQALNFYLSLLSSQFAGIQRDTTEENLQARIRGNIVMAISNKFGYLVLSTGNKSEMSTGYATLYGDMAGGFALIKDVYKTFVYRLARYRNSISPVIPERILTRDPTAELKPDQKDTDTLPPYEILDEILRRYIEEDRSIEDIIEEGFDRNLVEKVVGMVDRSEYKRRQAPPGPKITPKSFGKDRRMPITNQYFNGK